MMSREIGRMIELRDYKSANMRVTELGGVGMITVRGDLSNKRFQTVMAKICNLEVPKPLTINKNRNICVAWMSPDELLLVCHSDAYTKKIRKDLGSSLKLIHSLVLDVSGSRSIFLIEGTLWRELLAKGSPVDLRSNSFTKESFRRTRMGQISVAFWMGGDDSAYVICGKSYSSFFYDWLCNAAITDSLSEFF